jgi:hypothetical protein
MKLRATLLVALVLNGWGCGQSPTVPMAVSGPENVFDGDGSGGTAAAKRKPGSSNTFNLQFFNAVHNRHPNDPALEPLEGSDVSSDVAQLTGSVSGIAGGRVFTLAGGPFTLTIENVRKGHGAGDFCGDDTIQPLLAEKQLVGTPLTGTTTNLRIDENDGAINLVVDGITHTDGQTWRVVLFSTSGSRARITEDAGILSVVQDYGEVGFRVPGRGNKNVESYGCKLYFAFSLATPQ